ncbi:MAG: DUF4339 domain-containing protein [Planctomycetes bacterium]|nr:DUF4339 domain-containing protein [Planctomycetota bacterium]
MEQLAILIVIGVFYGIGYLVKKATESASQNQGARGEKYEASQGQIQDFLQEIKKGANNAKQKNSSAARRSSAASAGTPQMSTSSSSSKSSGSNDYSELTKEDWFVSRKGKRYGPYKTDRIRNMIEAGKLGPRSKVWNTSFGSWRELKGVGEFSKNLRKAWEKRQSSKKKEPKSAPSKTPLVPLSDLAGGDMKRAVIWAEILRPPVCLRGHIGHRPPTHEGSE